MAFDERMETSFIKRWAAVQAANTNKAHALKDQEAALDIGMVGVDTLKAVLTRQHGTIPTAWRFLLSLNACGAVGAGKMYYIEFCSAMRRIGYSGSIKVLWKELDKEGKGHITLKDIDLEAHEALEQFRKMLIKRYGSIMRAWKEGLDINHNGRVDEDEVVACCKTLGYSGDAKRLFRYLLAHPGKNFINFGDLDPISMQAYFRGDLRALDAPPQGEGKEQANRAGRRASTAASSFGKYLGARHRQGSAMDRDAENKTQAGGHGVGSLAEFKQALTQRYGTIVAAWRQLLDIDGNGRLSFGELSNACRVMHYYGNVTEAWNELDKDHSGLLSLDELDPETESMLRDFRQYLVSHFGGLEAAWHKGFNVEKSGRVDVDQFVACCVKIGYGADNRGRLKRLFRLLLPERGKKMIIIEDFSALTIGVAPTERNALWHGKSTQALPSITNPGR